MMEASVFFCFFLLVMILHTFNKYSGWKLDHGVFLYFVFSQILYCIGVLQHEATVET